MIERIRHHFKQTDAIEVSTPLARAHTVTDSNIDSLACHTQTGLTWLQTSPEYAMKMILMDMPEQAIFQICKAFRDDPVARWHRPEFTLLEWYRPNITLTDLIEETQKIVQLCLHKPLNVSTMTYQSVFLKYLGIDPFTAKVTDLQASYRAHHGTPVEKVGNESAIWQQLLLTECIEPHLAQHELFFITDFPPHAAALAKLDDHKQPPTAQRFECYFNGIELANGYVELQDAAIHRARFASDNAKRLAQGKPTMALDESFLTRLETHPLPECCGVALGLDRLFALAQGHDRIVHP